MAPPRPVVAVAVEVVLGHVVPATAAARGRVAAVAVVAALAAAGTPTAVLIDHPVGEVEVLAAIVSHVVAAGIAEEPVPLSAVAPIGSARTRRSCFGFAGFAGGNMLVVVAIAALGQKAQVRSQPRRRVLLLLLLSLRVGSSRVGASVDRTGEIAKRNFFLDPNRQFMKRNVSAFAAILAGLRPTLRAFSTAFLVLDDWI
mmetsp:Transcript_21195/g.50347  ORF Transcript_21195/g.50347 Transcript_21195/m.50347 type:complete len:200 (+) Transcript_21195:604-1203(+)